MSAAKSLHKVWPIAMTVAVTVASIEAPLWLVLKYPLGVGWKLADAALSLLFAVDLILRFRQLQAEQRPAPQGGEGRSTRAYRAAWLLVDGLAALPCRLLPLPPVAHILRLLKLARVGELMHHWRRRAIHQANLLRLLFFLFWLALIAHWIACGWLNLRGFSTDANRATNYIRAIYWCVTTLTTVGYGDITPSNNSQMLYAIGTMIVGAGVYGYMIANVATLLANIDPAKVHYHETLEKLTAFMRYRSIPPDLQRRILDYNAYLWEKRLGYDESAAMSSLPANLRAEVLLYLNREIIERVPFFRGAGPDLIRALALEMRPVIFMPGDWIMTAGEPGAEMYFISRGTVEIVAPDSRTVYATLGSGDFFGEMALLLNQPRVAGARASDYCDLYLLEKEVFDHILSRFPAFAARLHEVAAQRGEKKEAGAPGAGA